MFTCIIYEEEKSVIENKVGKIQEEIKRRSLKHRKKGRRKIQILQWYNKKGGYEEGVKKETKTGLGCESRKMTGNRVKQKIK